MPTDPLSTDLVRDNDDEGWAGEAGKQSCPLVLFIVIHHAKALVARAGKIVFKPRFAATSRQGGEDARWRNGSWELNEWSLLVQTASRVSSQPRPHLDVLLRICHCQLLCSPPPLRL